MAVSRFYSFPFSGVYFSKLGALLCVSVCLVNHHGTIHQSNRRLVMYPDVFSIWNVLYGSIAYVIGGGGQMATSMIFTMLTDTTPSAQRSVTFYYVSAVQRIVTVASTPLAAKLLSIDPWVTLWIGYGCFVLGVVATLFLPETLKLRQSADDLRRGELNESIAPQAVPSKRLSAQSVLSQALFSARNDVAHLWRFLIGSNSVMTLISAAGFVYPVVIAFSGDFLQYLTKRFNWTWSTVSIQFCYVSFCRRSC